MHSFVKRQDRDTFGVKETYNDSWGRAEAAKLDMVYDQSKLLIELSIEIPFSYQFIHL